MIHSSLCLHPHMVFSPCVCVSACSPVLVRTPIIVYADPILLQYALILTNYICKDPKRSYSEVLEKMSIWEEDTISTQHIYNNRILGSKKKKISVDQVIMLFYINSIIVSSPAVINGVLNSLEACQV